MNSLNKTHCKVVQYIAVFTNDQRCGNPAAVLFLDSFPETIFMQKIASKIGLSETAFVKKKTIKTMKSDGLPRPQKLLCVHMLL